MRCLAVGVVCLLLGQMVVCRVDDDDEEYDPYTTTDPKKREPTPCEVCKFFITELRERLDKSARSKEVIATGHGLERSKRFAYLTSELRLTEALLEPHICEKILEYNVHAERDGSNRYAKGQSETMGTLHGLVNKGVKVELGIPYELWDKPSAEVSKMHRICFNMAEKHEDDIEEWYYHHQDKPLTDYICRERYLKGKDQKCLDEKYIPKGEPVNADEMEDEEKRRKPRKKKAKKNRKGDVGGEDGVPAPPGEEGAPTGDQATAGDKEPAKEASPKADKEPAPGTEAKKETSTPAEPKQEQSKKEESKEESKQEEPKKEDSKKESKQEEPRKEKTQAESDSKEKKAAHESNDQKKDDASKKKDEL